MRPRAIAVPALLQTLLVAPARAIRAQERKELMCGPPRQTNMERNGWLANAYWLAYYIDENSRLCGCMHACGRFTDENMRAYLLQPPCFQHMIRACTALLHSACLPVPPCTAPTAAPASVLRQVLQTLPALRPLRKEGAWQVPPWPGTLDLSSRRGLAPCLLANLRHGSRNDCWIGAKVL